MPSGTKTQVSLSTYLARARAHTDVLFRLLRPDALYERPVPERHRLIFYLGHLETFDWNQICRGEDAVPSFHPEFDRLFAFGIDPAPGQVSTDKPSDWPAVEDVRRYNERVRQLVDNRLDEVPEQILRIAIEHRLMHAETLAYLFHDLPPSSKILAPGDQPRTGPSPAEVMIAIPEGRATLGQNRDNELNGSAEGQSSSGSFGWDNEFEAHEVQVPSFAISQYKVTNGQYLEFVRAGAEPPRFWTHHDGRWFWRTMTGELPLPLNWPVYVTYREAEAYARWAGKSLPTEPQFHRAAYGTPSGEERAYPWGDGPPDQRAGNFNFRRWDPIPVTANPMGDSAFGVSQLVGNGWEWTSTLFHPFPGFQPFPSYPGYSSPFFDGDHYVLKGASSRTAACFLRRSFRNWFRSDFPYVYAGFRCVEN